MFCPPVTSVEVFDYSYGRTVVKRLSLIVVARAYSDRLMLLWKIVAQAKLLLLLPFQGNAREGLVLLLRLLVAWHSDSNTSRKRTKKCCHCESLLQMKPFS